MLSVATVFFAAALVTALLNLSIGVGDKLARELKSYGANIRVVPKNDSIPLVIGGIDYNPLKGKAYINTAILPEIKNIFWRNNIVGYAPFLKTNVTMQNRKQEVPFIGTYFYRQIPLEDGFEFNSGVKTVFPYWKIEGAWPEPANQNQLLSGIRLAKKMGWKMGDEIRIQSATFPEIERRVTLTGILETGGNEEDALIGALEISQLLAKLPDQANYVSVSALTVPEDKLSRKARRDPDALNSFEYDNWYCTAYVSAISHQIEEVIPNASVRPVWQVAEGEGAIINKIQLLMAVVTIAAFIASALGISSLMSFSIMERSREIGLMKALGASVHVVHFLFLCETALVGAIGGLLGWFAGMGLSQLAALSVFNTTVSISWIVAPVVFLISILISLAGAYIPSRWIARFHPAEVLH